MALLYGRAGRLTAKKRRFPARAGLQITPFLAWQDYWATGSVDLFKSYADLLYRNTQIQWLDGRTGLLNSTKPISRPA